MKHQKASGRAIGPVATLNPMHQKPDLSVEPVNPKGNPAAAAIKLVKGKKDGNRAKRNKGRR